PTARLYASSVSPPPYFVPSRISASADSSPSSLYPLSLHDALPNSVRRSSITTASISACERLRHSRCSVISYVFAPGACFIGVHTDRKSTRLNSSHGSISYAVFCLKKKKLGSRREPDLHLVRYSGHY